MTTTMPSLGTRARLSPAVPIGDTQGHPSARPQEDGPFALTPETKTVYHGSPVEFDRVKPRPSKRIDSDGHVDWQGSAIFASPDYRVAVFYTHTRLPGFSAGIDLRSYTAPDQPIHYYLCGGKTSNEALDKLYADDGYVYTLDASKFRWEKGLGRMECVSSDESANIQRLTIHPRQEIDRLVQSHQVVLDWHP